MSNTEKALNYYRSAAERKRPDFVPAKVKLLHRVNLDMSALAASGRDYYANAGDYDCRSNQYGAISVRAANGLLLGVKPGEFEVIAWRTNLQPPT